MQPVLFSVKESLLGRPCWRRVGEDICYFRNHFSKSSHVDAKNYMTVTFSIAFPHDNDICYLAYHYPYTYSRLLVSQSSFAITDICKNTLSKKPYTVCLKLKE